MKEDGQHVRGGWRIRTTIGGDYCSIAMVLCAGAHRIEAWGNSKEGWWPYLVATHDGTGVCIGPRFSPELGDRLKDLKEAAARAYAIEPSAVKKGRNWA